MREKVIFHRGAVVIAIATSLLLVLFAGQRAFADEWFDDIPDATASTGVTLMYADAPEPESDPDPRPSPDTEPDVGVGGNTGVNVMDGAPSDKDVKSEANKGILKTGDCTGLVIQVLTLVAIASSITFIYAVRNRYDRRQG